MQPPKRATVPENLYNPLLNLLRLETIVPLGPFGLAVRFKILNITEETLDCEIPQGLPSLQSFTPSPTTLDPGLGNDGSPHPPPPPFPCQGPWWTVTLVHRLWPENLNYPLELSPQLVSSSPASPRGLLRFQIRFPQHFTACLEDLMKEWHSLDPGHPLLHTPSSDFKAS